MSNLIQTGSIITLEPFNLVIDVNYSGVLTVFTFPAGVSYVSSTTNVGTVNLAGTEWTIADYVKNFNAQITFTIEIDDVDAFAAGTRIIEGDTTDLTGEVQLLDNVAQKEIEGITCVDVNDCLATEYDEYDSWVDAIAALEAGDTFLASEANVEGWPWRVKLVVPFS